MKKVFIRSPYNYDVDAASNESGLHCEDASLAQQHFAEECDINHIVKVFGVTGILPDVQLSPRYGDFSGITDYKTALDKVIAAEDEFMSLPAQLRAHFNNDPAQLIEFMNDEANRKEAQELGIITNDFEQAPLVEEKTPTPEGSA